MIKNQIKMSKAEEKAMQYCCTKCANNKRNCGMKLLSNGRYCIECGNYIAGYHQAEKDLTDISWIKEVSGVKEMKRAKEEALKAYPPQSIAANYDTINRRDAFEYGYLKAEKDLELSWEDVRELYIIFAEVDVEIELCKADNITAETIGYYQEVLKRFKNLRHVK